ncbi:SDR family NAD(P)-dependent oxidoreductase [Thermomonospora amylolytica]|uniref:SDR family NAD(P)-dependent oxidoreductase n=1 Tax=Thermomonospora amylolytica TaxID=1411117 RepID=UPI000E6C2296|nr:SDR family oxidoreductase [Thermomonospora amylolytica]
MSTALVTGASSGLGEAFARALAARGHDLVLVARRRDRLEAVGRELSAAHGTAAEVIAADLTDPRRRVAVEERLADPERPVDVLVNGAGALGAVGPLAMLDPHGEEDKILLNVLPLVRLTRAALPQMVRRGRGMVLNISSVAAFAPAPGGATYAAAKAFVTCFSQAVHAEVGPLGVHVTAVCPGATRTAGRAARGAHRGRMGPVLEPDEVVRAALRDAEAGRAVSVPGAAYRLRTALARHSPGLHRRLFQRGWQERTARTLAESFAAEVHQ